jgi:hypothetical protein
MESKVKYLLSLRAIRERAQIVRDAAQAGKLNHFDLHEDRMDDVADFVTTVIKVRLSLAISNPRYQISLTDTLPSSEISVLIDLTLFPHMVAGSISR